MRNLIIAERGSVQRIEAIPRELREVFKTVWEVKQRAIVDMSVARGPFVCQSQSLNIHMADCSLSKLSSMHFHAWRGGLKTGMYYLRTRPKADAIAFTVDRELAQRTLQSQRAAAEAAAAEAEKPVVCARRPAGLDDDEACLACQ